MRKERSFRPAFLSGFYADASTVSPGTYFEDAEKTASEDVVAKVSELVKGQDGINVVKKNLQGGHPHKRIPWHYVSHLVPDMAKGRPRRLLCSKRRVRKSGFRPAHRHENFLSGMYIDLIDSVSFSGNVGSAYAPAYFSV